MTTSSPAGGSNHRLGGRAWRVTAVLAALLLTASIHAPVPGWADPLPGREWFLDAAHLDAAGAWTRSTGTGVTVAVIDETGLDPGRPELAGSVVDSGYADLNATTLRPDGGSQGQFHATWAALLIAGHGGGAQGEQGLAPDAKILGLHLQTSSYLPDSLRYAVDHGARVVSISLTYPDEPAGLLDAVRYAQNHQVIVVASAGNEGRGANERKFPAACPGVVAVAGSDQHGQSWPGSESGPQITVAAPAVDIPLVYSNPPELTLSGTSFSAPLTAAEAALLLGIHPGWTAGQVIRTMITTASGGGGRIDDRLGYGIINPVAALNAPPPADTTNPL
ncbi:S8 family serine peptidase, partial [Amycolatopsis rhizosphaerae]